MTNAQTGTLVLKDPTGSYFLVPLETLERGRVPEERTAELERLMTEAAEEDVQGHLLGLAAFVVGAVIGYSAVSAGIESGKNDATTVALGHKAVATANDLNAQFPR